MRRADRNPWLAKMYFSWFLSKNALSHRHFYIKSFRIKTLISNLVHTMHFWNYPQCISGITHNAFLELPSTGTLQINIGWGKDNRKAYRGEPTPDTGTYVWRIRTLALLLVIMTRRVLSLRGCILHHVGKFWKLRRQATHSETISGRVQLLLILPILPLW